MADQPTLLIVEDEPNLARLLTEYFGAQGYGVRAVEEGLPALALAQAAPPQLALLDIHLPDITGYDLAQRLRANRRTRDIPVIFLTSRRGRADRLQGLGLGAVDYIAKPFDLQELLLRVRNALQRQQTAAHTPYDAVTGLPEGPLVDEQIAFRAELPDRVMLVIVVRNLDAFQETYGFVAATDVLRAVSLKLCQAAEEAAGRVDFLGQLATGRFLLVTQSADEEAITRRLRALLGESLAYFYPLEDHPDTTDPDRHLAVRLVAVTPAGALEPAALKHLLLSAGQ